MVEVWVGIEGFNYSVSDLGRVRNDKTGHILKPRHQKRGYATVLLYKEGYPHARYVHQLVAEAFLKRYADNLVCDHIDSNPRNNVLSNIRLISQSYNVSRSTGRAVQCLKDGEVVEEYPCVRCVPEPFHPASICRVIKTGKPYKGYHWRYVN